uniref:DNA-directed DNA polymerase n=1 Tax=Caenorhabditis tropicalis TaxID=1561998 RepID=A0A1I7TZ65_9PELO
MKSYVGYDTILKFNEYILNVCTRLLNKGDEKMKELTEEELESYNNCNSCPQCENVFDGDKVRDHDHWTGLYRGPLCNACNLLKRRNNFMPVFFHNLKGYDSHHIISDDKSTNIEKFISFSYYLRDEDRRCEIRFLDSLGFMPSSLDYLSSNLQDDECVITKKYYKDENMFNLLRRKGVYPYDFMDSFEKYSNTELPPIENFYNNLSGENISNENYGYALKVWGETNCKTLEDYTRIYMINDVLLLADVFETFRNVSLKEYKLDPCWYYTSPGLAWDAMLFKTGVKLQTIKDIEMYNFIEKGIRGGMCNAMLRYSKANNKYMSNYNPAEESKYLLYLDANNLYGWAMSQKLPYDDFEFINVEVEMTQKSIKLDKPIYVGMAILDLSKYLMYEFHYDVMLPKYSSNLRLCYQDTDSYIYEIKTDDVYEDMMTIKEHFDFSDYPTDNKLHSVENKKVIGKFKDELNGKIMTEIVAFRPKQYAFKTDDGVESKRNKGVKKNVVKKEMTFDDYKNCLLNYTIERRQQTLFSSSKHQIHTNLVERRQAGKIIKKHKRELEKKREKLRDEMEELHLDKI